jgi:hypothetical protein
MPRYVHTDQATAGVVDVHDVHAVTAVQVAGDGQCAGLVAVQVDQTALCTGPGRAKVHRIGAALDRDAPPGAPAAEHRRHRTVPGGALEVQDGGCGRTAPLDVPPRHGCGARTRRTIEVDIRSTVGDAAGHDASLGRRRQPRKPE